MATSEDKRSVTAWALYDWANSAFATTVIAGFFPIFFKQYWSAGADVTVSTLRLGSANSVASVVVAVLAPFLGAIADRGGARLRFLFVVTMLAVVMTGALHFVARGAWELAVVVYVTASIGFSAAMIFYDSLLVVVTTDERSDVVSALGYALGYIGGGILFAINVVMTLKPAWFGLADAAQAVRVSFLTVAAWWAIFAIPIFLFVKEPPGRRAPGWTAVREGFHQLNRTVVEIRKLRVVLFFLVGYWLYIDAVQTVARMAVDFGLSLGFTSQNLILALLITQFVGFPAAIAFGRIGNRIGSKNGIYIGIAVYAAVCVFGFFMTRVVELYILAITIGLVQGGVQSLSRSYYSRIIPKNKAAEFFGFYNMLGKFATVVGPVLMGWVGVWTGNPRYSILSLLLLLVLGAAFLPFVDEREGRRSAQELEKL